MEALLLLLTAEASERGENKTALESIRSLASLVAPPTSGEPDSVNLLVTAALNRAKR